MRYILSSIQSRKKEKILLILAFLILNLGFVWFSGTGEYRPFLTGKGRGGIEFFYMVMNGGILIWNYILCILLIPNLYSVDYLIDHKSGLAQMLKTRLGYKKYFYLSMIANFLFTMITIIFMQLAILFFIHIFLSPIVFNVDVTQGLTTDAQAFASNECISLIVFMLLSAIGYGIFSSFLFSLQSIIKNPYVYRLMGIILGLILYTGTVLIADLATPIPILHNIMLFFFIGHLINPGVMSTTIIQNISPYITFIITLLIYLALTMILFKRMSIKEYRYD